MTARDIPGKRLVSSRPVAKPTIPAPMMTTPTCEEMAIFNRDRTTVEMHLRAARMMNRRYGVEEFLRNKPNVTFACSQQNPLEYLLNGSSSSRDRAHTRSTLEMTHLPPHLPTPFCLGDIGTPVGYSRLMRHAQISTTMNAYGGALRTVDVPWELLRTIPQKRRHEGVSGSRPI